ncbi:6-hydroxymethylpterin diphosphokinase MptE-like protein [Paenibacillus sp. GCM10027627]|uniref:motility associated factor glycosyltransferase family protein n=1 Tax=unclassified Paenibacillus TaxID=185978 RepID=UPI003632A547
MNKDTQAIKEMVDEVILFLPRLIDAAETVANQFYGTLDDQAWVLFGDVVTAIDDLYKTFSSIHSLAVNGTNKQFILNETIKRYSEEIQAKFSDLNQCMDKDDFISAGDVLRYEFLALFHQMLSELQAYGGYEELFARNMNFFESHYPHLKELIERSNRNVADSLTGPQLVISLDGKANLFIREDDNAVYLYSRYNIENELAQWIANIAEEENNSRIVLLFGVGLGHHLSAFAENYPHARVFLFEPDEQLFLASLYVVDWSKQLKNMVVDSFAVGFDDNRMDLLMGRFCHQSGGRLNIQDLPYYSRNYKEQKLKLLTGLKLHANKYRMTDNTLKYRYMTHAENIFKNIAANLSTPSLRNVKGLFSGMTAIIVGAGPSLEEDIEQLKKIKDSTVIIAAGTAIQSLLHFGIKPHLVVSMDGMEANYNAFKHLDRTDIPLLYFPQIDARIVDGGYNEAWHGFYDMDHISEYIMGYSDSDPVFLPTNSVTGSAVQAAIFMGMTEIIFTGQDFSYPNAGFYAPGALHVDEESQKKAVAQADEWVMNNDGGSNPTSTTLLLTLRNLEDLIAQFPEITFINSSQMGAIIKNAPFVPMEELLPKFESQAGADFKVKTLLRGHRHSYSGQRRQQIEERLYQLPDLLREVEGEAAIISKKLKGLSDLSRLKPNKALNTMAKIEDHWGNIVNSIPFKYIFEYTSKSEIHDFDRYVKQLSEERNIQKKAQMFEEVLGNMIKIILSQSPQIIGFIDHSIERVDGLEAIEQQ